MLNAEHDVAAGSAAFPLWLYPALQVPKLSHRQSEEFEEAEEEDQLRVRPGIVGKTLTIMTILDQS